MKKITIIILILFISFHSKAQVDKHLSCNSTFNREAKLPIYFEETSSKQWNKMYLIIDTLGVIHLKDDSATVIKSLIKLSFYYDSLYIQSLHLEYINWQVNNNIKLESDK